MGKQELDMLVVRRAARTLIVGCVLAAILTTASCGQQATSGGGRSSANRARTADDKTAVSSLRTAMKRSGSFYVGREGCFASGLVRDFGVEKLVAVGLLDKDLTVRKHALDGALRMSTRDANTFADVILHCVNWRLLAMSAIDDTPHLHASTTAAVPPPSPGAMSASCWSRHIRAGSRVTIYRRCT